MMFFTPTSWTLAEAFEATTGREEPNDIRFWGFVERGQLIAFGRRQPQLNREWIPESTCRSLMKRDLQTSTAHGGAVSFVDIVIYPVLEAPNAIDFLDGMSLKHAFEMYVWRDPQLDFLAEKAMALRPELQRVYRWRRDSRYAKNWQCPVLPVETSFWFYDPEPGYVRRAAEVLRHRCDALFSLLSSKKIMALGEPHTSLTNEIIPTIWSHPHYFIDVATGDVHYRDINDAEWPSTGERRWSAILLKKPDERTTFHVKPTTFDQTAPSTIEPLLAEFDRKLTPARASVDEAIKRKWPNGIPAGLGVKKRDRFIREWQAENGRIIASGKTIHRYLNELKKRRD
jgi:hypothetical protein